MLTCRACLRRCFEPLNLQPSIANTLRRNAHPLSRQSQQRLQSTDNLIQSTDSRPADPRSVDSRHFNPSQVKKLSRNGKEPWKNSDQEQSQKRQERAALRRRPAATGVEAPNLAKLGRRDPSVSVGEWERRKKEMRHLQDPLELAKFVKQELRKDKPNEVLQLVRMASQSMQCVVSWNHIIDHYLAKSRVSDALKVYNEMKKRAQFPDSYTYTILLRGLSINAHNPHVLTKALSVYHSLYAPNSRVEPSIIHTNAALRVCARALDMDALWGVAGKIPEKGPAAANALTYITIINAIRYNLLVDAPKGETEDETAARRERGIMEARRMWEGIVGRWRNADLVIDEELVCGMGRLLLVGSRPRDWDDILSLVEQTMDIPRLVPRLGSSERQEAGLPNLRAPNVPEQLRFDDDHLAPGDAPMRGDEFLPLIPKGVSALVPNSLSYARPSNNTLSLVLEACQKIVSPKGAREYWDLLTDPTTYNIAPDVNNLNSRLRNCRQARASAAAVHLLEENMDGKGIELRPGTFRIAMSTCVRDKNNHRSLQFGTKILGIMMKILEDADSKVVTMYANLALTFPLAKGSDLVDALTVLNPLVSNIRLQLGIGGQREGNNGVGAVYLKGEARTDGIDALRKVHGVYDRLLFSNLIPEESKAPFRKERARLSAFIYRVMSKGGQKWNTARETHAKETPVEDEDDVDADPHSYLKGR